MAEELDDLDKSIIVELQEDGRRPFRELSRALGVSEATIRARVKRLQSAGVLVITAYVDPIRVGDFTLSLLSVTLDPRRHDAVVEELMKRAEVSYLASTLGAADLLVEFSSDDDQAKWTFVNKVVRSMPGVTHVEVLSVVRTHKFMYRLKKDL